MGRYARTVGIGLALSLAAHAGLGLAVGRLGQEKASDRSNPEAESLLVELPPAPPPPPPPFPPQPEAETPVMPPEPPRVRLGLEEAPESDSKAWLGTLKPGVNETSNKTEVDQAALSPEPGNRGEAGAIGNPTPAPEAQQPREAPARDGTGAAGESKAHAEAPQTPQPAMTEGGRPPRESGDLAPLPPAPPGPSPGPGSDPKTQERREELAPAEKGSAPVRTTVPGGGGVGLRPGEKSPAESEAATTKPVEIRTNGQSHVLAARGLEVRTRSPSFSHTTRFSLPGVRPLVRVAFGRDGKVKEAAFLPGKKTGRDDIDQPLLDAIYQWTASGKPLKELSEHDPKARVELTFSIILR